MAGPQIGLRGTITVATRGDQGPGEVELPVDGGSATFIAYSDEPLQRGDSNAGTSLARANVTVLNGSDGLAQVAAGLVSQALAIYNEARAGLVANGNQVERGNGGQPSQPAE